MAKKTTASSDFIATSFSSVGVCTDYTGVKGVQTAAEKEEQKAYTYRQMQLEAKKQEQANYYATRAQLQEELNRAEAANLAKAQKKLARKVGNWGSAIRFEVNSTKQLTFRNFTKSHSARWKDHEIIGNKPLSEFTGPDLVSVTMSCTLSAAMNVNPRKIMKALEKALEKGKVDYLYIKETKVGTNKMKLMSMSEAYDVVLINGAIVKATVDLSFSEYVTKSYKHGKKVAGTKVPWEFLVGESAKFIGGKVYKTNSAKKGKKTSAVKVKVTQYQKGKKHPYYVKSIVDKNAAKRYTEEVEELQKKLKTAKRSEKKYIQNEITTLKTAAKVNATVWKGWVDDGTLKA